MRFGRSRKSGKTERKPDGHVRQSQLVGTFGVGAMIDLLQHAGLVCGLDEWSADQEAIEEPRLKERIQSRYPDIVLTDEDYFRRPPAAVSDDDARADLGVRILEFPAWFVCQGCRRLLNRRDLSEHTRANGRRYHECDRGNKSLAVPIRFVGACTAGHLQDFPWKDFAHLGSPMCPAPELSFQEGLTGDFSSISVDCVCGARQMLASFFASERHLDCRGQRPWLPPNAPRERCKEPLKLMVRTASNSYFPMVLSALSIPDPGNEVRDALSKDAARIQKRLDKGEKRLMMFLADDHEDLIEQYGADQVLEEAKRLASGDLLERKAIRTAEWIQFVNAQPEVTGEDFDEDDPFVARQTDIATQRLPEDTSDVISRRLDRIVLAHRLREVRVQVGFTRIAAASADNQGEFDPEVRRAKLAVTETWLPATTVQGEGVFFSLSPVAIAQWEKRPAVQKRAKELADGYLEHCNLRGINPRERPYLGARFTMLHTLSHLLIQSIAIECGYSASAIRERLYCGPYEDDPTEMTGILLYTGTVGSEGTLGGLVHQGRRLLPHLDRALREASLCSNDPLCASHTPAGDRAERHLEGAACHGCLFVAETSCERFNRYLDRSLVVPVVTGKFGDECPAFFSDFRAV